MIELSSGGAGEKKLLIIFNKMADEMKDYIIFKKK